VARQPCSSANYTTRGVYSEPAKEHVRLIRRFRYTITYTPSTDRILPTPTQLYLKIRNTSAIPLRAAYLHGPYTLHVASYPSTFNPHVKVEDPKRTGIPEFEPNLKAGGTWSSKLVIPEDIRLSGHDARGHRRGPSGDRSYAPDQPHSPRWAGEARSSEFETETSVTWIVEVTSQVIFSQSASVGFEILLGRDERSVELGIASVVGGQSSKSPDGPGEVHDHQQGKNRGHHTAARKGVYSRAIDLVVEDTTALWNKPELPTWDGDSRKSGETFIRKSMENVKSLKDATRKSNEANRKSIDAKQSQERKRKNIHLVVLTHGLHSNLGADMLYIKESIDATVKQARESKRARRAGDRKFTEDGEPISGISSRGQQDMSDDDDSDDEEVVVRGFPGNAVRTERGIQYLGKRLAKYVLHITFPDQPYRPVKKSMSQRFTNSFGSHKPDGPTEEEGIPAHGHSSVQMEDSKKETRAYQYTSISFIGHSLGGLVQTYAIAYIHKHSPQFFDTIRPINFVTLASPMLGLSNENPMYVKFALDFGLVGRTGQDLGLTWRAPNIARTGWSAVVSGITSNKDHHTKQEDPGSKPLLRILPTGPAHKVLRMFRNRTVYSNVVNDGIVPLRTSCLLFLDWKGIGRVEKARRENGLIGTMAGWGWREMTGQNSSAPDVHDEDPENGRVGPKDSPRSPTGWADENGDTTHGNEVPLPPTDITNEDDEAPQQRAAGQTRGELVRQQSNDRSTTSSGNNNNNNNSTLNSFFNFFRPGSLSEKKHVKMYNRSQTLQSGSSASSSNDGDSSYENVPAHDIPTPPPGPQRPQAHRQESVPVSEASDILAPPPRTTFFESAGDLLAPPIPPRSWIIDPSSRPVTIFHDRVYHPEDIPPPPIARPLSSRLTRSFSPTRGNTQSSETSDMSASSSSGGMKVEEKIARAYHRDLSWRKVLVRLEPDAHNNMFVRRTFANAYGWPVVKHLCDTHFADTFAAQTDDSEEPREWDRAVSDSRLGLPSTLASKPSEADESGVETPKARDTTHLPQGQEVHGQLSPDPPTNVSRRDTQDESTDSLGPLQSEDGSSAPTLPPVITREDSALWDDMYFEGTTDSESDDEGGLSPGESKSKDKGRGLSPTGRLARLFLPGQSSKEEQLTPGTNEAEIADFLSTSPSSATAGSGVPADHTLESHRGLGIVPTPTSPRSPPERTVVAGVGGTTTGHTRNVSGGSMAGVGLRRSIEEQVSPERERERTGSGESGVVEGVVKRSHGGA
jgi:hypothetical protein